jgi:hypothetical protein
LGIQINPISVEWRAQQAEQIKEIADKNDRAEAIKQIKT